jgi:hypothetical protein
MKIAILVGPKDNKYVSTWNDTIPISKNRPWLTKVPFNVNRPPSSLLSFKGTFVNQGLFLLIGIVSFHVDTYLLSLGPTKIAIFI